jgi:hypothetical protein
MVTQKSEDEQEAEKWDAKKEGSGDLSMVETAKRRAASGDDAGPAGASIGFPDDDSG